VFGRRRRPTRLEQRGRLFLAAVIGSGRRAQAVAGADGESPGVRVVRLKVNEDRSRPGGSGRRCSLREAGGARQPSGVDPFLGAEIEKKLAGPLRQPERRSRFEKAAGAEAGRFGSSA